MTLQLPRYRRSLLVDLWTRRLTSCSSLLHRAPFVGRFATKPTKEWPDLFPLSRYVTRKGSGDGSIPHLACAVLHDADLQGRVAPQCLAYVRGHLLHEGPGVVASRQCIPTDLQGFAGGVDERDGAHVRHAPADIEGLRRSSNTRLLALRLGLPGRSGR